MSDLKQSTDDIKMKAEKALRFIVKHRAVTVFVVASAAIILSLVQSRAYLNPPRNEERYQEGSLQINYKTVDEEIVQKLQQTLEDENISVDPSLVPNRDNPFEE